jgi:hypothetical protein
VRVVDAGLTSGRADDPGGTVRELYKTCFLFATRCSDTRCYGNRGILTDSAGNSSLRRRCS